ncbi:hypothetical protein FKM82_009650 [Ascaphus truei]
MQHTVIYWSLRTRFIYFLSCVMLLCDFSQNIKLNSTFNTFVSKETCDALAAKGSNTLSCDGTLGSCTFLNPFSQPCSALRRRQK